ncbi:hypothetical protein P7C70_g7773, partial [Phenoliferia sp. Uapishka_3]
MLRHNPCGRCVAHIEANPTPITRPKSSRANSTPLLHPPAAKGKGKQLETIVLGDDSDSDDDSAQSQSGGAPQLSHSHRNPYAVKFGPVKTARVAHRSVAHNRKEVGKSSHIHQNDLLGARTHHKTPANNVVTEIHLFHRNSRKNPEQSDPTFKFIMVALFQLDQLVKEDVGAKALDLMQAKFEADNQIPLRANELIISFPRNKSVSEFTQPNVSLQQLIKMYQGTFIALPSDTELKKAKKHGLSTILSIWAVPDWYLYTLRTNPTILATPRRLAPSDSNFFKNGKKKKGRGRRRKQRAVSNDAEEEEEEEDVKPFIGAEFSEEEDAEDAYQTPNEDEDRKPTIEHSAPSSLEKEVKRHRATDISESHSSLAIEAAGFEVFLYHFRLAEVQDEASGSVEIFGSPLLDQIGRIYISHQVREAADDPEVYLFHPSEPHLVTLREKSGTQFLATKMDLVDAEWEAKMLARTSWFAERFNSLSESVKELDLPGLVVVKPFVAIESSGTFEEEEDSNHASTSSLPMIDAFLTKPVDSGLPFDVSVLDQTSFTGTMFAELLSAFLHFVVGETCEGAGAVECLTRMQGIYHRGEHPSINISAVTLTAGRTTDDIHLKQHLREDFLGKHRCQGEHRLCERLKLPKWVSIKRSVGDALN